MFSTIGVKKGMLEGERDTQEYTIRTGKTGIIKQQSKSIRKRSNVQEPLKYKVF